MLVHFLYTFLHLPFEILLQQQNCAIVKLLRVSIIAEMGLMLYTFFISNICTFAVVKYIFFISNICTFAVVRGVLPPSPSKIGKRNG